MPTSTLPQHCGNIRSIPRHHHHCPNMEKNNDQPMPLTSARIRPHTTIKGTQPTNDISVRDLNQPDGLSGVPSRRSLIIPPGRYRKQTPSGIKAKKNVTTLTHQSQPICHSSIHRNRKQHTPVRPKFLIQG